MKWNIAALVKVVCESAWEGNCCKVSVVIKSAACVWVVSKMKKVLLKMFLKQESNDRGKKHCKFIDMLLSLHNNE